MCSSSAYTLSNSYMAHEHSSSHSSMAHENSSSHSSMAHENSSSHGGRNRRDIALKGSKKPKPKPKQVWYCCYCGFGPHNAKLDNACTNVGCGHQWCTECSVKYI